MATATPPLKIGIFIDGAHLGIVSGHYEHNASPHKPLDLPGLMHYIKVQVAEQLNVPFDKTVIVDTHLFMGISNADGGTLISEKKSSLRRVGVHPHVFPLAEVGPGIMKERGVDVALSSIATLAAARNEVDVVVLVTSDGDFVPLVYILQGIHKKMILFHCDVFNRRERITTTSRHLLKAVDLAINLRKMIETGLRSEDPNILRLFGLKDEHQEPELASRPEQLPELGASHGTPTQPTVTKKSARGRITEKHGGYGFIQPTVGGKRLKFLKRDLVEDTRKIFHKLGEGTEVRFVEDPSGEMAMNVQMVVK